MLTKEDIRRIAKKHNVSTDMVEKIYKSYFSVMVNFIKNLDLDNLPEDNKTDFRLRGLCTFRLNLNRVAKRNDNIKD